MDITPLLYRVLIGLCGFTLGLSVYLGVTWVLIARKRRESVYLFWSLAMFGYAAIIAALFPLVVQAKEIDAPFSPMVAAFYLGIVLKFIAFIAMFVLHKKNRPPPR